MYECPNCGGNLKFEIASQKMFCAYCESRLETGEVEKESDTTESFEVNVFACPQCGGEMLSGDTDATAFCSYCGSANILTPRISRERRPRYIIPFKKTKEDCKRAYARKMRAAFFVPKEYKDAKFVDGFRGIYMPYWSYRFVQKGQVEFGGKIKERHGDYVHTKHYRLSGDLNAKYEGYSFDASTSFYDNISEALGPYHVRDMQPFTPAYLSGFYADTADVNPKLYLPETTELVNETTYEKLAKERTFRKYELAKVSERRMSDQLHTVCAGVDNTMYPVWFMSYRNGDRVAYATVNGQTGKVVADMPVDEKRFLLGSLVLAVPIFFLLNMFLTLRPPILLAICAILVLVSDWLYYSEIVDIRKRETNADDKALQAKKGKKGKKKQRRKSNASDTFGMIVGVIVVACVLGFTMMEYGPVVAWIIAVGGCLLLWTFIRDDVKKKVALPGHKGFTISLAVTVLGALLALWSPVSDLWYYGGVVLNLGAVLYNLMDLIKNYNRLAMRKLPQFEKKGGDDNA